MCLPTRLALTDSLRNSEVPSHLHRQIRRTKLKQWSTRRTREIATRRQAAAMRIKSRSRICGSRIDHSGRTTNNPSVTAQKRADLAGEIGTDKCASSEGWHEQVDKGTRYLSPRIAAKVMLSLHLPQVQQGGAAPGNPGTDRTIPLLDQRIGVNIPSVQPVPLAGSGNAGRKWT
jgi:hypothetical protein